MCTLTWWREAGGAYEVFFNRDEKKSRGLARPPSLQSADEVSFLAPIDPDGGGTWMLANERGVLVCLLNRWQEEETDHTPSRSRGLLVLEMAALENVPAVEEHLRDSDLAGVRPFTMVGFDPVGERAWTWDGERLGTQRPEMPMCSSSYHFEEVASARRRRFQEMRFAQGWNAELLAAFQGDVEGGPNAFTARMCRPDAQTVSRSRVRVDLPQVSWHYLEEQPDLQGAPRSFKATLS